MECFQKTCDAAGFYSNVGYSQTTWEASYIAFSKHLQRVIILCKYRVLFLKLFDYIIDEIKKLNHLFVWILYEHALALVILTLKFC